MQSPDYQRDGITLYCGDCLEIIPSANVPIDLLLTDPPWGVNNDCDYTRFSGGQRKNSALPQGRVHKAIEGDDKPFDPSPWINFPGVVLWGSNHFSDKLPPGGMLIWDKKQDGLEGKFMSDAEVAWRKGSVGCFLFRHVWDGFNRDSERGEHFHPSQKPVALMQWCIERHRNVNTVCDPYLGAGATALACIRLGLKFVGCEKDPVHFATCIKRIEAALNADRNCLFPVHKQKTETQSLLFE